MANLPPVPPPAPPRRLPASGLPSFRRLTAVAALASALALVVTCRGRGPQATATAVAGAPGAEFLLSAGDSTYWVTSDAAGVRVRASPMFLARYGGRLYEIYAADDARAFYDADFSTQRIYRRDLEHGDSVPVFADGTALALARRYAAAHPHERLLGPDDAASDEPHTVASTDVSLVDVHGPYLTFEAHDDIDVDGGEERHTTRRSVVDLRSARAATLVELFGADVAATLVAEGRRALAHALDSVRALADSGDETGARALQALPSFRFTDDNFGLGVVGDRPGVLFVAIGHDEDGHSVTLPLPIVAAPGAPPSWWANEVRDALPVASRDSSELRWAVGGAEVVARAVRTRDLASLALRGVVAGARAGMVGRRREWPIARVPMPARQLYVLGRGRLAPEARRALGRAFNESALYGGDIISASYVPNALPSPRRKPGPIVSERTGPVRSPAMGPGFRRGDEPHSRRPRR